MSGQEHYDLSGRWHGFYNYPDDPTPTAFEAEIRDFEGMLTGETMEEGDSPDCYGTILHAVIEGRRNGTSVTFSKCYDYLERADYAVFYEGTLQAEGDEISGTWNIPHVHSGTFLMLRQSRQSEAMEREADEKVPI